MVARGRTGAIPCSLRDSAATREVNIEGIVPEPDGEWMEQVGRNLTDFQDGFLRDYRYLIHDRSSLFTNEFRMIPEGGEAELVRLLARRVARRVSGTFQRFRGYSPRPT